MKCSAQHLTQGQHLVSWLLLFEFPEIIFFIYIFQEIFIPLNHMIIFQFIKKNIEPRNNDTTSATNMPSAHILVSKCYYPIREN